MKSNQGLKKVFLIFMVIAMFASLSAKVTVQAGTPVMLRPSFPISSAKAYSGTSVTLITQYDVVVDGKVVIPAGSNAQGNVVSAKKKNILGQPGSVSIEVTSVAAIDGTQIPLRANRTLEGKDNMALSVGSGILCCVLGFLIPGEDAVINVTSEINAIVVASMEVNVGETVVKPVAKAEVNIAPTMMLSVGMQSGNIYEGELFSIENNVLMLKADNCIYKIKLLEADVIQDSAGNSILNKLMIKGNIDNTEKINWNKYRLKEVH